MTMDWHQLLSTERLGRGQEPSQDARSEFQRDYDRIIYSSAFRRLQDKTQVFPLAESDYVRTRLTHSIEVSCVGRSLGTLVGSHVIERAGLKDNPRFHPQEFGNVVAAACLAHDIGNPPFGHSGEEAIRLWFAERGKEYLSALSKEQAEDLRRFEGNAQGFRVLSRLQNRVDGGGMQLTLAVLAAFSKYPRRSCLPALDGSKRVSEKKFGFVVGDEEWFAKVAEGKGIVAHGYEATQGFVVKSGSQAVGETVPSMQQHVRGMFDLRQDLIGNGVLERNGDHFRFTQDYVFSSPSTAAAVVLGRSSNGRVDWKDERGRTLKKLQEQGL